jgi:hypothetical protein
VTFDELERRFKTARHTVEGDGDWESPYRLLAGAAYSIGSAHFLYNKPGINPTFPLSHDWRDILLANARNATLSAEAPPWWPVWTASYMLTNAIFRIAAATEKILGLVARCQGSGRKVLGMLRKSKNIGAGIQLQKAFDYLHAYPLLKKGEADPHVNMKKLLADQRMQFQTYRTIDFPLVGAIIQHDSDKHVPYPPIKDLSFDFALSTNAFYQACDVWDEAYAIHEAKVQKEKIGGHIPR